VEVVVMGFSVSGSAAIVLAGMFIGFGMFYAATAESNELVSEAREERVDDTLVEKNSDIAIRSVEYVDGRLTVLVNNTGAQPLSINATDVIVDNRYRTDWERNATVDGAGGTDLWLPREQLNVTVYPDDTPTRVKLVAGQGVADTAEVP
jgi:flagellar protein FlaF